MHTSKYQICSLYKCSFILIDFGYFRNGHMVMGITIKVDDQTKWTFISQSRQAIRVQLDHPWLDYSNCKNGYIDVGDEIRWSQLWDVDDGFGHLGHQHPLYLYQRRPPTSLSPTKTGQWVLLRFHPWPCALTSALLATVISIRWNYRCLWPTGLDENHPRMEEKFGWPIKRRFLAYISMLFLVWFALKSIQC